MPAAEDLEKLEYLTACIQEALRMFPSVPFLGRTFDKDTEIAGHKVAAGTHIVVVLMGVHHMNTEWDDAWEFKPERFLNGNRHTPFSFVPFSAGPRNCVGRSFALMELRTVLATLFKSLDFTVPADQDLKLDTSIVSRPANGRLLVQCRAR